MREFQFIETIKNTLNSKYIGDDCAHLKDLGIVVTQDSLVEDVHFSLDFMTPYQLGYKAVAVNLSDIYASGAQAKYLTISLSLPKNITNDFIKEFYEGAKKAASGAEIVGGDITGSDKIFISVTAIGATTGRNISSRSAAKVGYKIIVSGEHGASAAGLRLLQEGKTEPKKFIDAHLMPMSNEDFSKDIATTCKYDYAMMDTSDGLADALFKISKSSAVRLKIDFDKIPYDKDLEIFDDYKDLILYGGEDYQLVAAVPENCVKDYTVIGEVLDGSGVDNLTEDKSFDHFKEEK